MRIALIAPFGLKAKGTARARALPLGRALAAAGHEVALFVPPYDGPEDSGRRWVDAGVSVVNVPLPGGAGFAPWFQARLSWRLWRAVAAYNPDVAHVFKPKGPSGLAGLALWLASRKRPALVVDTDDWEGPGGWNDDPRAGYGRAERIFFAWQERYGLSHAHAWTVASGCLAGRAQGFGADPARVFLVPNGISPERIPGGPGPEPVAGELSPESLPAGPAAGPREPHTALLYTRFAGVRVPDVIDAWRRVQAHAPEARLLVAGRGVGGEETGLAAALPGSEVLGWVDSRALPALFARATLAIAPWADTPANRARNSAKILELMAAGVPVVAYAVGELPATLGDTGVLVPPGDPAAFAAAVAALFADPPRAARLGQAARQRVFARYRWDVLAASALQAYEAALRQSQ